MWSVLVEFRSATSEGKGIADEKVGQRKKKKEKRKKERKNRGKTEFRRHTMSGVLKMTVMVMVMTENAIYGNKC